LHTRFQVPPKWKGEAEIALFLPIGKAGDFSHPEALVHIDGQPIAGCDRHHQEIKLAPIWCDGKEHILSLHGWTGGIHLHPTKRLHMQQCSLVLIDQELRCFTSLAGVALETANVLEKNNPAKMQLYIAVDKAMKVLDTRHPMEDTFYLSTKDALHVLQEEISKAGQALEVEITAVGHAHIDVAWLWTLAQTHQKARRSFYTVLSLMDQFPTYKFSQSQPQIYEFVRQDDNELFERIKKRIVEGRWEAIGGMWVEADCNLTGSEALVRQFLLAHKFIEEHFSPEARTSVLWLPDVFGFCWSLPQLMREARLEYFFTIKIGWSQYNRLPFDTFWWQGLDGTKILTHFSTTKDSASAHASTYNAKATPEQIMATWRNFQQKDIREHSKILPLLMAYGWGDGGGGPTREMIKNITHLNQFPSMPRVQFGTVKEFYEKLEKGVGENIPTWNGELYLEFHRGTYTTQARSKQSNRRSEFILHDLEFLATYAKLTNPNYSYPAEQLSKMWKVVCLNQFHDILPGSSIGPVYEESMMQYENVFAQGQELIAQAFTTLHHRLGGTMLALNPTTFTQNDPVCWQTEQEEVSLYTHDGTPIRLQRIEEGFLIDLGDLPPYSVTTILKTELVKGSETSSMMDISQTHLENAFLLVELNSAGEIRRIYDKRAKCEVLPENAVANQFQLYEDRPLYPDAWDFDVFFDDRVWMGEPAHSIKVVETGPLRISLEIKRMLASSECTQRISLTHNSPRLDFFTTIDWHERKTLLKVAFPVKVLSPTATYDIQFGNVERPTHKNTSWDWAKFEVCAHKWADLSEGGYGVSLLNDCKYGYDIHDNVIRLTLLRGSEDPDPGADLGTHKFTYSLLPHIGGWQEETISQAYILNDPVRIWVAEKDSDNNTTQCLPSLATADSDNFILETVKWAEDGDGIILRLYESQRKRGPVKVRTAFDLAAAWRANILEENLYKLDTSQNEISLSVRPYEIVSIRAIPANSGKKGHQ
jgi:alpha-mannosidase